MIEVTTANPEIVEPLTDVLLSAFEAFATDVVSRDPGGLCHADALMGAHNFYKVLILDLERRCERQGCPDRHNMLRRVAVDTLIAGLGLEGYYRRRGHDE